MTPAEGERRRRRYVELQELVTKITYKPGARVDVERDFEHDTPTIVIFFPSIDVETGLSSRIGTRHTMTEAEFAGDDAEFLSLVYRLLCGLEIHEVQEWFRLNKISVVDPHPEITRARREEQRATLKESQGSIRNWFKEHAAGLWPR